MDSLTSLKQYVNELDINIAEAKLDLAEQNEVWNMALAQQTLRQLDAKRHKVAHQLRVQGATVRYSSPRSPTCTRKVST